MIAIRITVNDEIKVVQFWCDKTDLLDEQLFEKIENLYKEYAPDAKYRKVIYRTGERDLLSLTSDLLRRNLSSVTA